ncbi:MAG: glycosyltransferase family 39 protein [Clostridia bacterium]|nr:glycosyltransferase family 39 protein [Clostridia bacterium]
MIKNLNKEKKNEFVKNILVIFFIAIVVIGNIFGKSYTNLDELWNFNFSKNIADGLFPYKDFNMVQTPLLAIICSVFLKIFGCQLIVMRILAVILLTLVFFMAYLILKKLTNQPIAILSLLGFLLLFKDILCIDYNYAVLLMALILTYIELMQQDELFLKHRLKYDFIIGILAGISILFKQTTGLAIAMACIGYKIFKIRNKEDIKEFLKITFTRLIGVIIPVILFTIYLVINHAFNDFTSYAILGTLTFSNRILYKTLFGEGIISLLALLLPIILIVMFIMLFKNNTKKDIYVLFAYAIGSSIVIYPISDQIHFCVGGLITFIAGIYLLFNCLYTDDLFSKWSNNLKVVLYGIFSFLIMFFILMNLYNSLQIFNNQYIQVNKEKELAHFIGIPENKELKNRILEIEKYIQNNQKEGKNVYILDAEAAIYMIPLDIYNKDYDMFLKGNLGKNGEHGIIERIDSEDNSNVIYLIKKNGLNWQNPDNVRNYIIDNLQCTGDISIFWIFE